MTRLTVELRRRHQLAQAPDRLLGVARLQHQVTNLIAPVLQGRDAHDDLVPATNAPEVMSLVAKRGRPAAAVGDDFRPDVAHSSAIPTALPTAAGRKSSRPTGHLDTQCKCGVSQNR